MVYVDLRRFAELHFLLACGKRVTQLETMELRRAELAQGPEAQEQVTRLALHERGDQRLRLGWPLHASKEAAVPELKPVEGGLPPTVVGCGTNELTDG